jgi:hypothetical protein
MNGLDVHAIDSSKVAIENIYQKIGDKKILWLIEFCKQRFIIIRNYFRSEWFMMNPPGKDATLRSVILIHLC